MVRQIGAVRVATLISIKQVALGIVSGDLESAEFLGLQLDVHVSKPHLHRAHAMDSLEITVEVADLGVAAVGGDRLNGRGNVLEQLSGTRHANIEEVLPQRLANIPVEQTEKPGLSDPQ